MTAPVLAVARSTVVSDAVTVTLVDTTPAKLVQGSNPAHLKGQVGELPGLKAGHLDLDRVGGRGNAVDPEIAILVGRSGFRYSESSIRDGYFGSRDHSSG
jgi:hypothetical protein